MLYYRDKPTEPYRISLSAPTTIFESVFLYLYLTDQPAYIHSASLLQLLCSTKGTGDCARAFCVVVSYKKATASDET